MVDRAAARRRLCGGKLPVLPVLVLLRAGFTLTRSIQDSDRATEGEDGASLGWWS